MHKWLLGVTLFCLSCQNNILYHSYQPVPVAGWSKSDTLLYELPTNLPKEDLTLYVGVKHNETYPYRDLWLSISQCIADSVSSSSKTDTIHLYLANTKGQWKGDGIGGTRLFVSESPLTYHPGEKNQIKITHVMKDQPLHSISFVGVRLDTH